MRKMTKEKQEKINLILTGTGVGISAIVAVAGLLWLIISLAIAPLTDKVCTLNCEVKEMRKQILSKEQIEMTMDHKVAKHQIKCHSKQPD